MEQNLSEVNDIHFFDQDLYNTTPWFIDVKVEEREALMSWLKQNKIGTRIMYPPINKQEAYNLEGEHKVSNEIGKKGLWLPSSSKLKNEQIDYICKKINEFYLK